MLIKQNLMFEIMLEKTRDAYDSQKIFSFIALMIFKCDIYPFTITHLFFDLRVEDMKKSKILKMSIVVKFLDIMISNILSTYGTQKTTKTARQKIELF